MRLADKEKKSLKEERETLEKVIRNTCCSIALANDFLNSSHLLLQDVTELKERNAGLTKELKEAQNQRKLAMAEFSEINDKLAELRSQKTKLSRSQREKEEELGK